MLECRVLFHNPSHVKLNAKQKDAVITPGQYQPSHILLSQNAIEIYLDKEGKEEFGTVSPVRMTTELDRNANTISLLHGVDKFPTLEIKSDIIVLEAIEKYIAAKKGRIHYKGNLCYTPANRQRETIFTSSETNTNLRGFLNLALLALLFAKFRDIIVSIMQYGVVLRSNIETSATWPQILCFGVSVIIPIFVTWWIQKMGLQKKLPDRLVDTINKINLLTLTILPIFLTNLMKPKALIGVAYVGLVLGSLMKLYSYSDVLGNLRQTIPKILQLDKENKDIIAAIGEHELTKENLEIILKHKNNPSELANLKDLFYFLGAPTYCYQLWFPRNPKIRWDFLAKRICEFTVCWGVLAFTWSQYVMPIMDESIAILEKGTILEIIEKVIRLSFPLQVCWILFFFGTFQFLANIAAELQRFADRQFYKDWWNCRDLKEYWRTWNLPIHEFFTRHVYYPMLKKGYSKEVSMLVVFFISAVGHEYLASVALRLVALWAFLMMLVQLPIILIELRLDKLLKGSQLGNVNFWISFCFVGQPMALLLYYQLYLKHHGNE